MSLVTLAARKTADKRPRTSCGLSSSLPLYPLFQARHHDSFYEVSLADEEENDDGDAYEDSARHDQVPLRSVEALVCPKAQF